MANSSNLKGKLTKGLGTVTKVFDLFDAVAMVDKVSKNTAPILEKAIDRHYDAQQHLVSLPDVIHLPVQEAKKHLEDLGFLVLTVDAKPHQLGKHPKLDEVVVMVPKSGKRSTGSLVKLYVATSAALTEAKRASDLNAYKGLPLTEALTLLENEPVKTTALLLDPHRKYATAKPETVLAVEGKSGGVVKLYYVNQAVLEASQGLEQAHQARLQEQMEQLTKPLQQVQELSKNSLKTVKELIKKQ